MARKFKPGDRVAVYSTTYTGGLIKRYGIVDLVFKDGTVGLDSMPGKKPLFEEGPGPEFKKLYDLSLAHPKQCWKLK